MKRSLKFGIICILMFINILLFTNISKAIEVDTNVLNREKLESIFGNEISIDTNNINVTEILDAYDEISSQYSNDEIAEMIQENKKEIQEKTGISLNAIDAGTKVLKDTDENQLKDIINNDLDVNEIQNKIDNGYTPLEIIEDTFTPEQTAKLGIKLFLANVIVQTILRIAFVDTLFMTIIRWIIFKKARKHGWATLIPIYREITYLKVCNISPWCLLLILLPIIGWLILLVIYLVSRFKLSKAFGRGFLFGLGLLIFKELFEIIIAVSKNEYIYED